MINISKITKNFHYSYLMIPFFLASPAFGKVVEKNGYTVYAVENFMSVMNKHSVSMLQENTGYNLSCGPSSVLSVLNYYGVQRNGKPGSFSQSVSSAKKALDALYRGMGEPTNTVTDTDQLKFMVRKFGNGWDAKKANGSSSIETNFDNMKVWLGKNQPVIVALEPGKGPKRIGNNGHIVVIIGAADHADNSKDQVTYYDPYFGERHVIKQPQFSSSFRGQLPYLRITPK